MADENHDEQVEDHAAMNGFLHSSDGESHQSSQISIASTVNTVKSSRASSRLKGTVKWFNAKQGYGFVTREDTGEDVFIHFSGIARKNPLHLMKSLGDGETVEFNLMATNVTGPDNRPVRGNPYVSHIPIRRNDSFSAGAGDAAVFSPPRRFYRPVDAGNSRIPRWAAWSRNNI